MTCHVREITDPDQDPAFEPTMKLYEDTFPEDEREPVWRLADWVRSCRPTTPGVQIVRHLLVCEEEGIAKGFFFFEFFREVGMGYWVYLVVDPRYQGTDVRRRLTEATFGCCREDARFFGTKFHGCVMEVERIEDAVDENDRRKREQRLKFAGRMGARIISRNYVQPALTGDKDPVPLNLMWIEGEGGLSREEIIKHFYRIEFEMPETHPFVLDSLEG